MDKKEQDRFYQGMFRAGIQGIAHAADWYLKRGRLSPSSFEEAKEVVAVIYSHCLQMHNALDGSSRRDSTPTTSKKRKPTTKYHCGPAFNKLNFEKAKEIRELYATGNYSQDTLAKKYGTVQQTISAIVTGKAY